MNALRLVPVISQNEESARWISGVSVMVNLGRSDGIGGALTW